MSAVRSIIYVVVDIIINSEVSLDTIFWRKNLNSVSEAMRIFMRIEMSRTVIRHKVPVTRRDSLDIVVLNPEIPGIVHP